MLARYIYHVNGRGHIFLGNNSPLPGRLTETAGMGDNLTLACYRVSIILPIIMQKNYGHVTSGVVIYAGQKNLATAGSDHAWTA
jgi:hypothetical protein